MSSVAQAAGLAVIAAAITASLVAMVRRWAERAALLDHPNARSSHTRATPRLGGIGVAVVLIGGLVSLALGAASFTDAERTALLVVAAGAAGVSLVSLVDDLRPLPAAVRLVVHVLVAGLVITAVGEVTVVDAGVLGAMPIARPWSTALTVLWIAGFTNAFNFMDGIDGIAGGQAFTAGLGWVLLGLVTATPAVALPGALLAGASAGFLVHNWAPATIFMGDMGSALLGFVLASLPWAVGGANLWLVSALLVWPFVFDALLTLLRRARRGERVWEAHRSHLYQRLAVNGATHRSTASLYGALAATGLVCAVTLLTGPVPLARGTVAAVVLAAVGLWFGVSRVEARRAQVRMSTDA